MRCSPGRSKRSPGGRSTGGTPHGRERYHTGGVRGRSSASGEGTRGGGVGGGGGAGAQRRGGPLAAGTRIRVAAGDPGGGVDGAERTAGGERELWLRGRAAVSAASGVAGACVVGGRAGALRRGAGRAAGAFCRGRGERGEDRAAGGAGRAAGAGV